MKIFEEIMAKRGQIPHEKISSADLTLRLMSFVFDDRVLVGMLDVV